jgi:hypothetical protein
VTESSRHLRLLRPKGLLTSGDPIAWIDEALIPTGSAGDLLPSSIIDGEQPIGSAASAHDVPTASTDGDVLALPGPELVVAAGAVDEVVPRLGAQDVVGPGPGLHVTLRGAGPGAAVRRSRGRLATGSDDADDRDRHED